MHNLFTDFAGLGASAAPYSKSHAKRLNRKAKQKPSMDLTAIGDAIAVVDEPREALDNSSPTLKPRPGLIGEQTRGSLTRNQRKRTL